MNWLHNLLGVTSSPSNRPAAARRPRLQLGVESLEERALLSGSPLPALRVSLPHVHPGIVHLPVRPAIVIVPGGGKLSGPAALTTTVTIDPCSVASEAQLRQLATAVLAGRTLHESHSGNSVTVSNMQLVDLTCPGCKVEVSAKIRYKKTRGFPQFSVSGHIRFSFQAALRVTLQGSQIVKAELVLSNFKVLGLDLNHVPNWLDNWSKVRNWLSAQMSSQTIDVTPWVQAFVANGGSLGTPS
jgi:hypothetical protein